MPERYGSYATAWRRLKRWSEEGVWNEIIESLQDSAYIDGSVQWTSYVLIVASSKQKKGRNSAYNGHKRRNGIKIHACVICEGFH